jgi:hypothetical protein
MIVLSSVVDPDPDRVGSGSVTIYKQMKKLIKLNFFPEKFQYAGHKLEIITYLLPVMRKIKHCKLAVL